MDCLAKLCKGAANLMPPGIHFDMPRDVYDNIPALSATVLKKWISLSTVPGEFADWLSERWSTPASEALTSGLALDCLLLEPSYFDGRFVVLPADAPRRPTEIQRNAKKPSDSTRYATVWWEEFTKLAEGKTLLTAEQNANCLEMMRALQRAPAAQGVFEHCRKAVLVAEVFGFPCKCETDLWNERIPHILDLKTAKDVRPGAFVRAASTFQYIEQAVFYLALADALGSGKDVFTFLAVRNSKPWSVMSYNFAPEAVPDHHIIASAVGDALKEAAEDLVRRLGDDDFVNDPDWQFLRFPEWQVRAASFGYARQQTVF